VMPTPPADPADDAGQVQIQIWKDDRRTYLEKTRHYTDFLARLYGYVLGQCSQALQDKLRSTVGFDAARQDGIALLIMIRTISNRVEDGCNIHYSLCGLKESWFGCEIGKFEHFTTYYDRFVALAKTMNEVGVTIVDRASLESIAVDPDNPTAAEEVAAYQAVLAIRFLRSMRSRFKNYLQELEHAKLENRDHYPTTLADAYSILQRRASEGVPHAVHDERVAFSTNGTSEAEVPIGDIVPGDDGLTFPDTICYSCNRHGHYRNHCPSTGATIGFSFSQSRPGNIPSSWLLLDSQSNVDIVCNASLLNNIHTADRRMYIRCNAGRIWTDKQGYLPGYGLVWFCPKAIANILSLSNVTNRYRVAFDSWFGDRFVVTNEDGE
jgi:hypothetical protein